MSDIPAKVYLLGGGGVPNYGDELIIQSWLRWYVSDLGLPAASLTVSGSHERVLRSLFAEDYPDVRFSQAVRESRWRKETTFYASIAHGYAYLDDVANEGSPLHRELEGATLFHLHGGGYLNSKWPTHGFMLGLALWAKENVGCRVVGTGLGLGPLRDPDPRDDTAFRAFRAFDLLEVRDQWSHEFLVRSRLYPDAILGHDDAFLQPARVEQHSGSTLHLSLRHDDAARVVTKWIPQRFVESFDHHIFWACTGQDSAAYAELTKRFPYFNIAATPALLTAVPASHQDFMVAQRFHPHLMGARLGMQGMYRSGSDYYDAKHGLLADLGSSFVEGNIGELTREQISWEGSELAHKAAQYMAEKRELAARIMSPAQLPRPGLVRAVPTTR